jgi:ATP-dependent Lon protease
MKLEWQTGINADCRQMGKHQNLPTKWRVTRSKDFEAKIMDQMTLIADAGSNLQKGQKELRSSFDSKLDKFRKEFMANIDEKFKAMKSDFDLEFGENQGQIDSLIVTLY